MSRAATDSPAAQPLAPLTACAACSVVIEPCTAAFIRVRAPTPLCTESNVAIEPLASLLDKHGCATLPSVYALSSSEFFVPIANPSNSRVEIPAGTPVAAIAPVALAANSPSTAVTNPQLSRNKKNFAKYCANCKLTRCPTRPLTSARSSRPSVSISIYLPKATRMWGRQVSRFTKLTRQTRARSDSLCVASRTAKCAKQLRRILRSLPTLASRGSQRRLGHRLS